MKRTIIIFIIIVVLFCTFFICGKQSSPKRGITVERAIEYTKQMLDDKSRATITDINNPNIKEVEFDEAPSIYLFEKKTEVVGRTLYRITYNTEQDGLLGPIVFYVDKLSGEIIGMDYRE